MADQAIHGTQESDVAAAKAGSVAEIGWELLTTGIGLRKRPDVAAYERELIRLRRIEDEERRLEQSAQKLQSRHARCGQRALPSPDAPRRTAST